MSNRNKLMNANLASFVVGFTVSYTACILLHKALVRKNAKKEK